MWGIIEVETRAGREASTMPPLQDGVSDPAVITELPLEEEDDAPARARRRMKRHREVLLISCAVCLLALLLHELPDGRVTVRGLPQFPLPQTCMSRALLGLRCPGCGLTRSIIHLAHGDWQASWHDHRLGGLLGIVIALQIPYRLYKLRRPERGVLPSSWQAAMGYALIVLLLGNWLLDVAAGRLQSP
jgi:hypothetical protein